jgi:hypothetical protein
MTALAVRFDSPPEYIDHAPPIAVDLLAATIEQVRPLLLDRRKSTKQRVRILWAAVVAARDLGASDRVHGGFGALAVQTNLINHRGWWTGNDVRPSVRRFGIDDIDHGIMWGLRGWDPFGKE